MVNIPESLTHSDLVGFWQAIQSRLERNGPESRGRMRLPHLSSTCRLTLESLTDKKLKTTVNLEDVESGLIRLEVGEDLAGALGTLGFPVSDKRSKRLAARDAAAEARAAARAEADEWNEPWVDEWFAEVVRTGLLAGLTTNEAVYLVNSTRRVVETLATGANDMNGAPLSRVELAAKLFGSAHALDPGTRLERAATRALDLLVPEDDGRGPWERAGAHFDLVSGPALTWNLRVASDHVLHDAVRNSNMAGVPFLFTQLALREHPLQVDPRTPVLAVENPRVLENAVQQSSSVSVVCTNGNPSRAVQLLLEQLVDGGVDVRYHGDFDAAGLSICARMFDAGLTPWKMDATDYERALLVAEAEGVDLPFDKHSSGATPWCPDLQVVFNHQRRIVHEERLLGEILDL